MEKRMNNKGFSLPELIIVIAIMAVLVGVLLPQYLKYVSNAKVSSDVKNAEELASAFKVEIADGHISAGSYTGNSGSTCSVLQNVTNWPEIQRDKRLSWKVTVSDTNLEKIEIGNGSSYDRIYPDPQAADGYYTLYYHK